MLLFAVACSISGIAQNYLSVPFNSGFIGRIGNNAQNADSILNFGTLALSNAYFMQNSSTSSFEVQGNDITGTVRLVSNSGEVLDVDGAIVWRENSGQTILLFGFNPSTAVQPVNLSSIGTGVDYVVDANSNYGLIPNTSSYTAADSSSVNGNAATSGLLDALNAYLDSVQTYQPVGPVAVDDSTTFDTTPTVTGDVTLAAGETFSVIVDGNLYDTSSGVTIIGTEWSLTLGTTSPGTYDISGVITNQDGYTLSSRGTLVVLAASCAADVDSDGVCDDGGNDLCTNTSACNYDGSVSNVACQFDDAIGVCGGTCTTDADSDGVCDDGGNDLCTDTSACNYDGSVSNVACQFDDACGVCGGTGIPAGDCDCNGNQNDAIGVCGGTCTTDSDSDGVCDDGGNDLCTDTSANNYTANPTAPCTYGAININVVDTIMGCEAQTDAIALDLDTLHSGTGTWTYSLTQGLTGFASSTLSGSTLSIDFSASGADSARVNISGTNTTDNAAIEILVVEGAFPYWNSTAPDGGNEPTSATGGMSMDLGGAYDAPVTVHYYENAVWIEAPSGEYTVDAFGPELTAMTDSAGNLVALPAGDYWIRGYTNQFGCFNPEPATSGSPTASPQLRLITVPHLVPD